MVNRPIFVETKKPLRLPDVCLCCGKDTRHKIKLEAKSPGDDAFNALGCLAHFIPLLHIVFLIQALQKKRVKIPVCWSCEMNRSLPDSKSWGLILAWLFLLFVSFYCFFAKEWIGWGFLGIGASMVLLVLVVRNERGRHRVVLPVHVQFVNGLFQYRVWDGPLYHYLSSSAVQPDPANFSHRLIL